MPHVLSHSTSIELDPAGRLEAATRQVTTSRATIQPSCHARIRCAWPLHQDVRHSRLASAAAGRHARQPASWQQRLGHGSAPSLAERRPRWVTLSLIRAMSNSCRHAARRQSRSEGRLLSAGDTRDYGLPRQRRRGLQRSVHRRSDVCAVRMRRVSATMRGVRSTGVGRTGGSRMECGPEMTKWRKGARCSDRRPSAIGDPRPTGGPHTWRGAGGLASGGW